MSTTPIEVRISSTESGTLNGSSFSRDHHKTIHEAAIAQCVKLAARDGELVVHAIDGQRDYWLTVNPNGDVAETKPPSGDAVHRPSRRRAAGTRTASPAATPRSVDPVSTTDNTATPEHRADQSVTTQPAPPVAAAPNSPLPLENTMTAELIPTTPSAPPAHAPTAPATTRPPRKSDSPALPHQAPIAAAHTSLATDRDLIYRAKPEGPTTGWRGLVYRSTKLNLGLSRREAADRALISRIRADLGGQRHRVAVVCFKGGIGKTSVAAGAGMTFAHYRADPTLVADFNPDNGDLSARVLGPRLAGVTDLVRNAAGIRSLADLSRYTKTAERLTVLPGEPKPRSGQGMTSAEFDTAMDVLETYYSLITVDTGEGVTRPIMPGILDRVDSLVIAAGHSKTGAESAADTLDWLEENGYSDLARNAVVALTAKDGVSSAIDTKQATSIVANRCRTLVVIPPDPHVADGAVMKLASMKPRTRRAYMQVAAAIADSWTTVDSGTQPQLAGQR